MFFPWTLHLSFVVFEPRTLPRCHNFHFCCWHGLSLHQYVTSTSCNTNGPCICSSLTHHKALSDGGIKAYILHMKSWSSLQRSWPIWKKGIIRAIVKKKLLVSAIHIQGSYMQVIKTDTAASKASSRQHLLMPLSINHCKCSSTWCTAILKCGHSRVTGIVSYAS
jgi:hypothetical protein